MKLTFNFEKKIEKIVASRAEELKAQAATKIVEYFQFDILRGQYIEKLWRAKGVSDDTYIIYINEDDLKEINFSIVDNSKKFIDNLCQILEGCNIVNINKELEVIDSCKYSNGIINYCYDISKSKNCAFLMGRNGIKIFINGEMVLQNSLFIDDNDYEEYTKKKDISEIKVVFKKYKEDVENGKIDLSEFFVNNEKISKIDANLVTSNILRNRPEKYIKEHIKDFLSKNIRRTFNMNYDLKYSNSQIDLYTEDNDFYFITIKWLGSSLSDCGTKVDPPLSDYYARSGMIQTLEYIKELREIEGFSERTLKKGYLIVFDARDIKNPIQYYTYENIDVELRKYMDHFDILNEILLNKPISA